MWNISEFWPERTSPKKSGCHHSVSLLTVSQSVTEPSQYLGQEMAPCVLGSIPSKHGLHARGRTGERGGSDTVWAQGCENSEHPEGLGLPGATLSCEPLSPVVSLSSIPSNGVWGSEWLIGTSYSESK